MLVSIQRPLGYEPNTLPLRQSAHAALRMHSYNKHSNYIESSTQSLLHHTTLILSTPQMYPSTLQCSFAQKSIQSSSQRDQYQFHSTASPSFTPPSFSKLDVPTTAVSVLHVMVDHNIKRAGIRTGAYEVELEHSTAQVTSMDYLSAC